MARELQLDLGNYSVGVVDTRTGESYQAVKVLDISEDCSGTNYRSPVTITYGRTTQGLLVQFREDGQKGVDWTMKQLEEELRIPEHRSSFGTRAKWLGLTRQQLWEIIVDNTPAT